MHFILFLLGSLLCLIHLSNSIKPNVLFLIIDDLRTILSSYGDETSITLNLNDIASNGFVFENAYAQVI